MSRCRKTGCKLLAWKRGWCYSHWRELRGWIFDSERKVFVRRKVVVTTISER
jgi:hypothetical protein